MLVGVKDHRTGRVIKLTKVVGYSSGGVAILMPYHTSSNGLLFKYKMNRTGRYNKIERAESVEYTATDAVKLSYHNDGFVQFSSQNQGQILSGRDPETGQPRGLGLVTPFSLDNLISTGPAIAIGFWGLSGFVELPQTKHDAAFLLDTAMAKPLVVKAGEESGYVIEIFMLSADYARYRAVNVAGRDYVRLAIMIDNVMVREEVVRMLYLPGQSFALGLLLNRVDGLHMDSSSGYYLMGPSDGQHALMAIYPPPLTDNLEKLPSLNYGGLQD